MYGAIMKINVNIKNDKGSDKKTLFKCVLYCQQIGFKNDRYG